MRSLYVLILVCALNIVCGLKVTRLNNDLKNNKVQVQQPTNASKSVATALEGSIEQAVKFYVYTRENAQNPEIVEADVESIIRNVYSPLKPTTFSIHGLLSNKDSAENHVIVSAKLEQENCNVIVVDYSLVVDEQLIDDIAPHVGAKIADFIVLLQKYFDVKLSQIHLVGFSVGAQSAGFTGQYVHSWTGDKVGKITGLDPAGGMFENAAADERLSPDDAHFVEVIHTNGGIVGYYAPCGHADYYPNGGTLQPGCSITSLECSHIRAFELVTEMWSAKNEYVVTKCASTVDMNLNQCNWVNVNMGRNFERAGIFYLETNNVYPYGKGSYVATFL